MTNKWSGGFRHRVGGFTLVGLLLTFCLSLALGLKAVAERPIILDAAADKYASELVFITTASGIYTFNRNTGTWGRITQASGLPDNRINVLGLDRGILWAGTDSGLGSADIKLGDWQVFDLGAKAEGLAFDEDYAWAAGEFGLARFDRYAETWEKVLLTPIRDIATDADYLWLATDSGALRYSCKFGRVEPVTGPRLAFDRVIVLPGRVWFSGPGGIASVRRGTGQWAEYTELHITDWADIGDSLFVVSDGQVFLYEPKSDNLVRFRDVELPGRVEGICPYGQELAFALESSILVYNQGDRSLKTYTTGTGLEPDSFLDVFADSRFLLVVGRAGIQILDRQTGIWKKEKIQPVRPKSSRVVYLDDAGAHLRLVPDTDVRLSGRAWYSDYRTLAQGSSKHSWSDNIGLMIGAEHVSGRALSLYYDDADRKQVMYGAQYRGTGRDILSKVAAGRLESQFSEFDLVPAPAMIGASARLAHETSRLDGQAGRMQSRQRSDYFYGRTAQKVAAIADIGYSRGSFFRVSELRGGFAPGADTVFVDDRSAATNGIDTRVGYTVGGISGDFDVLINGLDYFIDYRSGIVHFLSSHKATDVIVLALAGRTVVIQSDSVQDRVLENRYFVGPGIVPGSFDLVIADTSGVVHPLSEFGLDADRDGRVDPEFLSCDLGWLSFPDDRPFPTEVYEDSVHVYTMNVRFRSKSDFYFLAHAPVERASERVRVDGEPMIRGSDYVMDYTTGVLLFVRDDIVSDFSEVDVEYSSVEQEQQAWLYSVQPVVSLGRLLSVGPGFAGIETERFAFVAARAEAGTGTNRSVKFMPQVAINTERALAQAHSLTANYDIYRLQAEYRGYGDGFGAFGAADRRYGKLRHSGAADLGVEPLTGLVLGVQFRRESQADSAGAGQIAQYANGRLSFARSGLPSGYALVGQDDLPTGRTKRAKLNAGYEFTVLGTKLRLDGLVHGVRVRPDSGAGRSSLEYAADAGFALPFPVQGNLRFRRDILPAERCEQDVRVRLNIDAIPGLYYTGSYQLEAMDYRPTRTRDLSLASYFYNDLHVAPGRWLSGLSIVNMSLGTGSSIDEYCPGIGEDYGVPVFAFGPLEDVAVSSAGRTGSVYGLVQLNPRAELAVRIKRTLSRSGQSFYGLPVLKPVVEDEVRVDYEPSRVGLLVGTWNRRAGSGYPAETEQSFYFEWSRPWSTRVRTKLYGTFRDKQDRYTQASAGQAELRGNLQTLCRFSDKSYVTLDLGASRQTSDTTSIRPAAFSTKYSVLPGLGLNLNLFRFLYLQLNYQANLPLSGPGTHTVSTKVTGQF